MDPDAPRVHLYISTLGPHKKRALVEGLLTIGGDYQSFAPVHEDVATVEEAVRIGHAAANAWARRDGFEGYFFTAEFDGRTLAVGHAL
jgi:hypothetical protein